jgi:hypothetical protein
MKRKGLTPKAEFITIDLDVRSRRSLTPLLEAWSDVHVQTPGHSGKGSPRWLLRMSYSSAQSADKIAMEFVELVENLPKSARRCWDEASKRTWDIGIQAGLAPQCFEEVALSTETLHAIARVGGRVQITLNAPHREW